MSRLLRKGDIIKLEGGMKVYAKIPEMFVYDNAQGSSRLTKHDVVVGEVSKNRTDISEVTVLMTERVVRAFSSEGFKITKNKAKEFVLGNVKKPKSTTFSVKPGRFVVLKTKTDGGCGGHDPYPDGHHVYCKGVGSNIKVDFYQTGCFSAMIEDIEPINKKKKSK